MFLKKLLEMISDDKGTLSSLRIVMILFSLAFAPTYIFLSIKKGEMMPLPESVLGLMISLIIGKLGQKKMEKSESSTPADPAGYNSLEPDI